MPKTIFHIGFPKAASSSLQVALCSRDEVVFLGLYPTNNVAECRENVPAGVPYLEDPRIKEFYLAFSLLEFDAAAQRDLFCALCSDYGCAEKPLFFSYEGMTSPMFSEVAPDVKLARMIECCLEAEFVLVARKQGDLLKSQYRDWPFDLTVKNGRGLRFDEWIQNELNRSDLMGPLKWFELDRVLKSFVDANCLERLHLLCFEDYVARSDVFGRQLASILRIDASLMIDCLSGKHANRGVTRRMNVYRRIRRAIPLHFSLRKLLPNCIQAVFFGFMNRGGSEQLEYSPELEAALEGYYRSGNVAAADLCRLDLEGKGYWT